MTDEEHSDGIGFNATNVRIGDLVIHSECTLVSMTDHLTIYIPGQGAQLPQWIDVSYCNLHSVEVHSLRPQNQGTIQSGEEMMVELVISLVDSNATGFLFLISLQPSKGPDKIALTVKDTLGELLANAIQKARGARIMEGTPVGRPLSDLQLPTKPMKIRDREYESLWERRTAISLLAESPSIAKVGTAQREEKAGQDTTSIVRTNWVGMDHSSEKDWISHNRFNSSLQVTNPLDLCPNTLVTPTLASHIEGKGRIPFPKVATVEITRALPMLTYVVDKIFFGNSTYP